MGVSSIQCNPKHEYVMATGRFVHKAKVSRETGSKLDEYFNFCPLCHAKEIGHKYYKSSPITANCPCDIDFTA